jgi:hypothetical protein
MEIEEFKKLYFQPRIRVKFEIDKIDEESIIVNKEFTHIQDFKALGSFYIPKYIDHNSSLTDYSNPNSTILKIKEWWLLLDDGSLDRVKVNKLIEDLRSSVGLVENIEIILAKNSNLGKSLIVDGVHRALALYWLEINCSTTIEIILRSPFYKIKTVSLISQNIREVFHYDFRHIPLDNVDQVTSPKIQHISIPK